jgi:hypothetical protein
LSYFRGFGKPFPGYNWGILPGVLVEQTLENKTTAVLGWAPFGDVALKRTPVTLGKAGGAELRRRAVPFWSDYREGAVISRGYGWGTPWPRGEPRGNSGGGRHPTSVTP